METQVANGSNQTTKEISQESSAALTSSLNSSNLSFELLPTAIISTTVKAHHTNVPLFSTQLQ